MRNRDGFVFGILIVGVVLLFAIWIVVNLSVYASCDNGVVVKNTFDWPVCVQQNP